MTEARVGREATLTAVSDSDPLARVAQVSTLTAHHLPGTEISARIARVCVYVAIHREAPGLNDRIKRDRTLP